MYRVLCKDGIEVSVSGRGRRTLISIRNGAAVRFWADTEAIEAALTGSPAHLDAFGGNCQIMVKENQAIVTYGDAQGKIHSCRFAKNELEEALAGVRSVAE